MQPHSRLTSVHAFAKRVTPSAWCCLSSLAAILATGACEDPVVIKRLDISPSFVCSGDRIHFDWHITHVDALEVHTAAGQRLLRTTSRQGTWDSPPVQASWDYLRLTGCQDGECEAHFYDIQLIDNPKWTCGYFLREAEMDNVRLCGSMVPNGRFSFLGNSPAAVDYVNPRPESQAAEGLFTIHRLVDGYSYDIPPQHFSSGARVVQVKFENTFHAALGYPDHAIDPDAMFVEAVGPNTLARTRVLKDQSLTIANPFHPGAASWHLLYPQPEEIIVGVQYGIPDEGEKANQISTGQNFFPRIIFQVKCDQPPSP